MLHDFLMGLMLFPVSLFGMACNWCIIVLIHRLPTFKHSFGYLSTNQAIADSIHSTIFFFYVAPMILMQSVDLINVSHHFGGILLLCYDVSTHSHLLISLNRLIAVYSPIAYDKVFSVKMTNLLIVIIWVYSLITCTLFFEILDCKFFYDHISAFFRYTNTEICIDIAWYPNFCKYVVIVVAIGVMDMLTSFKMRQVEKRVGKVVNAHNSMRKRRQNINFFKQTIVQGVLFVIELVTYFFLVRYVSHSFFRYLLTTFTWCFLHSINGVFTIIFNPEFRSFLNINRAVACVTSNQPSSTHNLNNVTVVGSLMSFQTPRLSRGNINMP